MCRDFKIGVSDPKLLTCLAKNGLEATRVWLLCKQKQSVIGIVYDTAVFLRTRS